MGLELAPDVLTMGLELAPDDVLMMGLELAPDDVLMMGLALAPDVLAPDDGPGPGYWLLMMALATGSLRWPWLLMMALALATGS